MNPPNSSTTVERRRSARVRPPAYEPIAASLMSPERLVRGEIRDLSPEGATIVVAADPRAFLEVGAPVELMIRLPRRHGEDELRVFAFVVRRDACPRGMLYAACLDERRRSTTVQERRALEEYVGRRTREFQGPGVRSISR